jgi:hemerythrin-like domain-containing protein
MAEHRVIERVITALEAQLEHIASYGTADPRVIDRITDFIRTYADRCHHGKEEDILFRRLAEKDLGDDLVAEMRELIEEHVSARAMTRALVDANDRYATGDAEALGDIERAMHELAEFYPAHIAKEDRHFFKPSIAHLSEEERECMLEEFAEFDRKLIHEKYRLVAEELARHE